MLGFFLNPKLLRILVHITNKCNYNCSYCYVDKTTCSLKPGEWLNLLQQAHRMGVKRIGILGGEPLCEPELLERLLVEIKKFKMGSYIYTNGSLLSESWIDKLKSYDPVIIFKYDIDNQVYQKLTRQKKYSLADIEQRIKLCTQKGLRVMTFTALLRDNYLKVREIFDNSLRVGALPTFERYLPVRGEEANAFLEINDQEYSRSMNELRECYSNFFKKIGSVAARIFGRSCGCYGSLLSVSPTGEVLPCPYLPDAVSLGNIRLASLKDIHTFFKKEFTKKYMLKSECARCKDRLECGGGCFTYTYLKKGNFSSNCTNKNSLGFCSYYLMNFLNKRTKIIDKVPR
jgi:radical SAM protein with 4Fe4S-binding SPASM domain